MPIGPRSFLIAKTNSTSRSKEGGVLDTIYRGGIKSGIAAGYGGVRKLKPRSGHNGYVIPAVGDVIRHCVTFNQLNPTLFAQVSQDFTNPVACLSVEDFLPVLRYDYHVVLAFPAYVRQTSPVVHSGSPFSPNGGFPEGRVYAHYDKLAMDR